MSKENVIAFFRGVAGRSDILESLKVKSKEEVFRAAASFGLPFDEQEFDSLIWNLEIHLARKRGEPFDAKFPLWSTMWGRYYLEYLVLDLLPSFQESDFNAVMHRAESTAGQPPSPNP